MTEQEIIESLKIEKFYRQYYELPESELKLFGTGDLNTMKFAVDYAISSTLELREENKHLQSRLDVATKALEEVDEVLAHLEDFTHGNNGEMITNVRHMIQQIKTNTPT